MVQEIADAEVLEQVSEVNNYHVTACPLHSGDTEKFTTIYWVTHTNLYFEVLISRFFRAAPTQQFGMGMCVYMILNSVLFCFLRGAGGHRTSANE